MMNTTDYDESEKHGKIRKQENTERKKWSILFMLMLVVIMIGYSTFGNTKPSSLEAEKSKLKGKQQQQQVVHTREDVHRLEKLVEEYDAKVRAIKKRVDIFEIDEEGQQAARLLQDATRKLIQVRYGVHDLNKPFRVRVELEFQESMPDFAENGSAGSLLLELAPISLLPHSVFMFLEIVRNFQRGAFHRNAPHVLQAMVNLKQNYKSLAFQEYSEQYPHKKGTVGYAGRPSGPGWYISIQNNTRTHGPGSQQTHNPYEADSCFGRVIEGFEEVAVKRIHKMPGKGFVNDRKKQVIIKSMTILVPISSPKHITYQPYSE